MSKEVRIGEVSPMLKRLEKAKCRASEEDKSAIKKIESKFRDVEGIILGLRICEKEIVRSLEVTTRDVDKILEDNDKSYAKPITDPKKEFVEKVLDMFAEGEVAKGFNIEQAHSATSIIKLIRDHVHENHDKLAENEKGVEGFEKNRDSVLGKSSEHSPEPSSSGKASPSGGKILTAVDRSLNLEELFRQSPAMLSYIKEAFNALDIQVKRCMFCICLFPENSNIKKRLLIHCWIGAGYVGATGDRTAEQNGHAYFEELVSKCLIQPTYKSHSVVPDGCSLPSLIRKIVMSAATRYSFNITPNENNIVEGLDLSYQDQPKMMFNIDGKKPKFEVKDAEKIRVMHIGMWQSSESRDKQVQHVEMEDTDFLEQLGSSGKLRYLSLQGVSRIVSLPDSIGKHTNLVILDLRACHNLEKLPDAIRSFKKLTHLDVSKCYLLEHLPKGIASLSGLQVLKGFVIPNSRSKDPCRLGDLSRLEKLRKLSISIARESNVTKEELDKVSTFKALRSLTITWGSIVSNDSHSISLTKESTEKSEVTEESVSATAAEKTKTSPPKESTELSEVTDKSISATAAEKTKISPPKEITEKSQLIEKSVSTTAAEKINILPPKEITEKSEVTEKSVSDTAAEKTMISPPKESTEKSVSAIAAEKTKISPPKESIISEVTEKSASPTAAEKTKFSPSKEITEKSVSATATEKTKILPPKEITEKPEVTEKSVSATAVEKTKTSPPEESTDKSVSATAAEKTKISTPKKTTEKPVSTAAAEKTKISPPEGLEKLDIRCFPHKDPPDWLNASKLKNLKKLYFRGGKLAKIPGSDSSTTFPPFLKVSVLRFRFLKDLNITKEELKHIFPHITYLEICECLKLSLQAENLMYDINAHHR